MRQRRLKKELAGSKKAEAIVNKKILVVTTYPKSKR